MFRTIDVMMALLMIGIGARLLTSAVQGLRTGRIDWSPAESFQRATRPGRYWWYTVLFGVGGTFIIVWNLYRLAARS